MASYAGVICKNKLSALALMQLVESVSNPAKTLI